MRFPYISGPAGNAPLKADWALGGQCADAVEVGISADESACILHTGRRSAPLASNPGDATAQEELKRRIGTYMIH